MAALHQWGRFVAAQQGAAKLFARLSRHIIGEWFANTQERAKTLAAEFSLIYGHIIRLALCVSVHQLAWIGTGTGIGGWIAFRLLGAKVTLVQAIAIKGLLHPVLAIAFLVPGHVDLQEAAYIGFGAAFGVSPEIAPTASLLRRARDLALGIPNLLCWQWLEWRRLRNP
ncbi:MAG: hypothetical protein EXR05_09210 [Acetobacteraceae bacterium]|nr:hypothetical protein [Acetobacteraceae bacterium]